MKSQTEKEKNMSANLINIADRMKLVTFQVLHNNIKKEHIYDHKRFSVRIGKGKSTHYSPSDIEITFGIKMLQDTLKLSRSKSWRHGKEILNRKYFNGKLTYQHMCVAVILHEYAHFMVHMQKEGTKGSVHNHIFYSKLDQLYKDNYHEKVLTALNEYLPFRHLAFVEEDYLQSIDYNKSDLQGVKYVKFKSVRQKKHFTVQIYKLNRTRFVCNTIDGTEFNVPYSLISEVFNETPEEFKNVDLSKMIKVDIFNRDNLKNCEYIEFLHEGRNIKVKIVKLNPKRIVAIETKNSRSFREWKIPYVLVKKAY